MPKYYKAIEDEMNNVRGNTPAQVAIREKIKDSIVKELEKPKYSEEFKKHLLYDLGWVTDVEITSPFNARQADPKKVAEVVSGARNARSTKSTATRTAPPPPPLPTSQSSLTPTPLSTPLVTRGKRASGTQKNNPGVPVTEPQQSVTNVIPPPPPPIDPFEAALAATSKTDLSTANYDWDKVQNPVADGRQKEEIPQSKTPVATSSESEPESRTGVRMHFDPEILVEPTKSSTTKLRRAPAERPSVPGEKSGFSVPFGEPTTEKLPQPQVNTPRALPSTPSPKMAPPTPPMSTSVPPPPPKEDPVVVAKSVAPSGQPAPTPIPKTPDSQSQSVPPQSPSITADNHLSEQVTVSPVSSAKTEQEAPKLAQKMPSKMPLTTEASVKKEKLYKLLGVQIVKLWDKATKALPMTSKNNAVELQKLKDELQSLHENQKQPEIEKYLEILAKFIKAYKEVELSIKQDQILHSVVRDIISDAEKLHAEMSTVVRDILADDVFSRKKLGQVEPLASLRQKAPESLEPKIAQQSVANALPKSHEMSPLVSPKLEASEVQQLTAGVKNNLQHFCAPILKTYRENLTNQKKSMNYSLRINSKVPTRELQLGNLEKALDTLGKDNNVANFLQAADKILLDIKGTRGKSGKEKSTLEGIVEIIIDETERRRENNEFGPAKDKTEQARMDQAKFIRILDKYPMVLFKEDKKTFFFSKSKKEFVKDEHISALIGILQSDYDAAIRQAEAATAADKDKTWKDHPRGLTAFKKIEEVHEKLVKLKKQPLLSIVEKIRDELNPNPKVEHKPEP
jgi:hypothetical protein